MLDKYHVQTLLTCNLFLITFVSAALSPVVLKSAAISSLDGEWKVKNSNGSIAINSNVPGSVYTDLLREGIISDPYYRDNDVLYKWIGREDWTFYKKFNVECEVLQKDRIVLVFNGLDTISQISLNGALVGTSQNMFIRYMFDVKHLLQANNSINVSFESPVKYAEAQHEKQALNYVIPPTCPPPVQNGECHVNYVRKIQSSFSWDWGPSFPTQGIWKHVELLGFNSAVIRDVTVITQKFSYGNQPPTWRLKVNIYLDTASSKIIHGNTTIYLDDVLLMHSKSILIPDSDQSANMSVIVDIPQGVAIKQWWPNGLGEQILYKLKVSFSSDEEQTSKMVKIGFRTLELVQEPIKNSSGLSFYFRVNGIPFFAKGSNWIPADSFPERVTPEYTRNLLQSAKDANMNMIRVWGGGAYETDEFYHLADEMGIFIWQDIMFAVALYPINQDFLNSVAIEVRQQVRRLQHHPCLLLWAGNNENEQGIAGRWWPAVSQRFEQYKSDYIKLYIDTIMPVVKKEDPSRPFLSSSPSNGLETEKEDWVASDPQNVLYGDVHFYTYTGEEWNWQTYPRARFVSEYGFQSYPSFESFANVSEQNDWTYPYSDFLDHRQHHMFGNLEILRMIAKHMTSPSKHCGVQGFKDILYLSQIVQAMSIKTETEKYRCSQSEVVDGEGKTMGALYWQLNDIWQGPSWSSIEYGGKWKMLHYYAKNFFSPILVSSYVDNGTAIVYVVSDLTRTLVNGTLNIFVYKWSSFQPTYYESVVFDQPPLMAQKVYAQNLNGDNSLLNKSHCASQEECFLYFTVTSNAKKQLGPSNFLFLSELKNAKGLEKSKINVTNVTGPLKSAESNTTFIVTLDTTNISPFVWLEVVNIQGRFSDNGFLMVKNNQSVLFYSSVNVKLVDITNNIAVRSLTDVCQ